MSSSKRTKHTHVRFFYIKDVIERGDMSVEYCPTGEIWADVLTTPLQGIVFKSTRRSSDLYKSSVTRYGAHDAIPQVQWTKHFMEAQGYDITENIMYHDNKSSILLESNGKMSSSKRTKHIHVRFFYIKDFIDCGDMSVEYFPTGEMWADILTKPMQRIAFNKMRDMLIKCPVKYFETVFKDIDKVVGVHKPDFYPFPS